MAMTRIKELAEAKGFTLTDLADVCAMERTHLSKIAHGHVDPTTSTARKIADALGVSIEDLFATPKGAAA